MIGKKLIQLHSVDSTNKAAHDILKWDQISEGTVITAWEQIAGRGQKGASWESKPGENITLSLILYPDFITAENIFVLNEFVSLAIREFLYESTRLDFKIKWPNDIVIDNKKICGILIENILRGQQVSQSIIGIGLNINQTVFNDYMPEATSMKLQTGNDFNVLKSTELLCHKLDEIYDSLREGNRSQLHEQYKSHLFRLNEQHKYIMNDIVVELTITDVLMDGRIVLKSEKGDKFLFDAKELKYIYQNS